MCKPVAQKRTSCDISRLSECPSPFSVNYNVRPYAFQPRQVFVRSFSSRKKDKDDSESENVCPEEEECLVPTYRVEPKQLPVIEAGDCPCVESNPLKEGEPLRRLERRYEPKDPPCPYVPPPCSEPRADDCLKIEKKRLPKMKVDDCPCVDKDTIVDAEPLKRLKKRPLKPPPPPVCEEPPCITPRADEGRAIVKKCLPPMPSSDCPCTVPKNEQIDVPLPRLKARKVEEPPKICPGDPCDEIPRADRNYTLRAKELPVLPPSDCPCVEPPPIEDAPPLPRLKFKHVPEPPKICPVDPCEEIVRADDGLKVIQKELQFLEPSDCECIPPPPPKESPPLVPPKRRYKPKDPPCPYIPPPCPKPRADDCYEIEAKTLPTLGPGKCPCVENVSFTDVKPLKRLKKRPVKPPPPPVCEEPPCPTPRADEGRAVVKKCLQPLVPMDCPCLQPENTQIDVPLPKLVKRKVVEPPKICPPDPCDEIPRADANYRVHSKNLPFMPPGDCPCIQPPPIEDAPPLKRLRFDDVPEPPKICPVDPCEEIVRADDGLKVIQKKLQFLEPSDCECVPPPPPKEGPPLVPPKRRYKPKDPPCPYIPPPCPKPRADDCYQIEAKTLPTLGPGKCPCVENVSFTDVKPLKRLKKRPLKPPPPPVCEEPPCPTPRADEGRAIVKKSLQPLVPMDCPCLQPENTQIDVPLPRLKARKVEEPPKICPGDPCDEIPRADRYYTLRQKELPVLPPSDCPCVEPPPIEDAPPLPRLKFKHVPEPPKICPVDPCEEIVRADDGLKVIQKQLQFLEPSDCECTPPPPPKEGPPLVPPKRRYKPKDPPCPYVPPPCPKPRADDCYEIESKTLPTLGPGKCPCVENVSFTDVIPLKRLKKRPLKPPPQPVCEEPPCPTPRADARLTIVKKCLPVLEPSDCPCIQPPIADELPPLPRLKKGPVKEPPKICPPDPCDEIPRADRNLKVKMKTLPTLRMGDCPCIEQDLPSKNVPLKRLKKRKVEQPKKVCVVEKCPPRSDEVLVRKKCKKKKIKYSTMKRYSTFCSVFASNHQWRSSSTSKRYYSGNRRKYSEDDYLGLPSKKDPNKIDRVDDLYYNYTPKKLPPLIPRTPSENSDASEVSSHATPTMAVKKFTYKAIDFDLPEPIAAEDVPPPIKPEEKPKLRLNPNGWLCLEKTIEDAPSLKRLPKTITVENKTKSTKDPDDKIDGGENRPVVVSVDIAEPQNFQDKRQVDRCSYLSAAKIPLPNFLKSFIYKERDYTLQPWRLPDCAKKMCADESNLLRNSIQRRESEPSIDEAIRDAPDLKRLSNSTRPIEEDESDKENLDSGVVSQGDFRPLKYQDLINNTAQQTYSALRRYSTKPPIEEVLNESQRERTRSLLDGYPNFEDVMKDAPALKRIPKLDYPLKELDRDDRVPEHDHMTQTTVKGLQKKDPAEVHDESPRADYTSGYKIKRRRLPSLLGSFSKSYSTYRIHTLRDCIDSFNLERRSISTTNILDAKKKKDKCKKFTPCPRYNKQDDCPLPPQDSCPHPYKFKKCCKQHSPYPSYSECKDPDYFPPLDECPDHHKRFLQPKYPLIPKIPIFKAPPPYQGRIDPSLEEKCIREKLGMENTGFTFSCDSNDEKVPLRVKDCFDVQRVPCPLPPPPKECDIPECPCPQPKDKCQKVAKQKKEEPKSFWQKICDYFKPRPNCPSPDEWKRKMLREKAEKAAKEAGLAVCEKEVLESKKCRTREEDECELPTVITDEEACPITVVEKPKCEKKKAPKKTVKAPKAPAKKAPKVVVKKEAKKEPKKEAKKVAKKKEKGTKPKLKKQECKPAKSKCSKKSKKSSKKKRSCACKAKPKKCPEKKKKRKSFNTCKTYKTDCPPRVRDTCEKVYNDECCYKKSPYPSYSELHRPFPYFPINECTVAEERSKVRIRYTEPRKKKKKKTKCEQRPRCEKKAGKKRHYTTFAFHQAILPTQVCSARLFSSKTSSDFKREEKDTRLELAEEILGAVSKEIDLIEESGIADKNDPFYRTYKELQVFLRKEIKEMRNKGKEKSSSGGFEEDDLRMLDVFNSFCKEVRSQADYEFVYDESEKRKIEEMDRQLDELLNKMKKERQ